MNLADDAAFTALTRRISERAGLALGAYKDRCLRRRIAVRMRACGVHTYTDYLAVLNRRPDELEQLMNVLTINVTKFFRNPETWEQLGLLLTEWRRLHPGAPLRVWSAGCASGEEPYTLAMVLAQLADRAGQREWLNRVSIDATDIDRESLERSRAARYPKSAFEDTPPGAARRYCREIGEFYEVSIRLRSRVNVIRHDLLLDPPPHPPYDLIVCRNVIIYFDRPSQERLLQRFADALVPGGMLLLGKVETIFGPARSSLELVNARERIYRRPAA